VTSYNEVADELVKELNNQNSKNSVVDQKNIRRRVYDVLNVLCAMNIISKDKKEIQWIGFPSNGNRKRSDLDRLMVEKNQIRERIEKKREFLKQLASQQQTYNNLIKRNLSLNTEEQNKLFIPFIVVNTGMCTTINCEMDPQSQTAWFFEFNKPFEIQDDHLILSSMGLSPPELPGLQFEYT